MVDTQSQATHTQDVQAQLEQLSVDPTDSTALEAVEARFSGEGRWEELLRVYEDGARRAQQAAAVPLLRKAAGVCLRELSSSSRAEHYLKRALDMAPSDMETLRALRDIYTARGEYEPAAEVYEREVAREADTAARARGLVALADMYATQLGRSEKALAALRQAQKIDPKNLDAYKGAAAILEAQGRLEMAQSALEKELELGGVNDDMLARLAALGARFLERPKLHDRAKAVAERVTQHRPNDQTAIYILRELQAYHGEWVARVAELTERAHSLEASERDRAADTWITVAEIQLVYGSQGGTAQTEAALTAVDKAFACKPGHPVALRLLEEVYGAEDRFDELSLKLEMMAAYTRDPAVAVELYLKAALHHAVRLDDPEAAARIYQRVLQLQPGNRVASNALAEYFRERSKWQEALDVLAQWAERATQGSDKVAAHYACCRIYEEELNDRVRARPHYEAMLALDPSNQAAARALEDVYRESGDHQALGKVLEAKLAGLTKQARWPVLRELGELYAGPLADAGAALEHLGEVYRVDPSADLRERLEELAARSNDFASLVSILEGGLARIQSDTDRVEALHSLAAVYEGARDAPLEALRIHRRILALAPADGRAKASVDRLLDAAAASGDKISVYREQADATADPAEKAKVLHKLGAELVEGKKDYVAAIDVYREISKLAPQDVQALDQLLGLYRRDNRWAEVAETLQQKLEGTPPGAARIPVLLEMASIRESQLAMVDHAVDSYCAILDIEANHGEATAGLERLITRTRKVGMVAERLRPIYEAVGRWDAVAYALEILLDHAPDAKDPPARASRLVTLSQVYEKRLGQASNALGAALRAFQAEPSRPELPDELERLGKLAGELTGVLRAYRAAASVLEEEARLAMVLRAARLATESDDFGAAAVDYLRLLAGGDEAMHGQALAGLQQLLSKDPKVSTRIVEGGRAVAASLDPEPSTRFWRAMARFYERDMNQPSQAIDAWKRVIESHHGDAEATAELDRLMQGSADPTELVNHLRGKMQEAPDDTTRAALGGQLAEVLAEKVGDIAAAVTELNRVAELVPGQRLVWQRLVAMHTRLGQPTEAAQAMHREINLLADGPERRERLVDYAELIGTSLGDPKNAVLALQSVLTPEPGHARAVVLLEKLRPELTDAADQATIADMLLASYEASQRWNDAVALLNERAQAAEQAEQRTAMRLRAAAIRADHLQDPAGAFAEAEAAFREQPMDEQVRYRLEQLAEKAGAWEGLASAYEAVLAMVEGAAQQTLRRKLAQILDQRLGRGAEAVEHYKAAGGGALPGDLASLEAMERLMRESQQHGELFGVLEAVVRLMPPEEPKRRAHLLEMAKIAQDALSDSPRAVEVYRALLQANPKDLEALRPLSILLGQLNQPEELFAVLGQLIELGVQNPDLIDDYLRHAEVATEIGKHAEAFASYRSVLLKKREHPDALDGLQALMEVAENKLEIAQVLEPVYTAKQDHAKLAWVLERRLDGTAELAQRKSLLRRIGDIYENRLQQKESAFNMARRSLGEDPADMGVRMWIEKLAGETGAFDQLASVYVEEASKVAGDQKLALQFHRRAAAIYHEKLGDTSGAVGEYQAILELEPRDEKALVGLETIFRTSGAHAELVGVLQRRYAATAGLERKREYLNEIASLQSESIGDLESAVGTYRQILELTPEDTAAQDHIERLLGQLAKWQDLVAFYDAEIERLAQKRSREAIVRRHEFIFRRGRALQDQFADTERAAAAFRAVLEGDPEHVATLAYLEARATEGSFPFIALLEQVYQRQGHWQKYVDLLEGKLNQVPETAERRAIYLEIARVYDEQLRTGDMAFLAVTRAFNENRADVELLGKLEALAEKHNAWEELVAVLGQDVDAIADTELRQRLLRKLGEICGQRLGDVQAAAGYLQNALQYDPADKEALAALDALLEKNEMWAALADALERRIELASEPGEKSALLERLAGVWGDRLMDAEAALRCHQQILEIDPDHPLTLKSMQKLYAEVQDWDALAKNLQRQAEVLTEPEEQVRIHAAAGELFAEELGDNDAAIMHWLSVVKVEVSHELANQALEVLLAAEERFDELAEHYRRQLTFTHDAARKSEINRRLGVILGEKLGRTEDALQSWLEVLQVDAKNVEAMRALLPLYTERAMWEEFVGVARRLIPLAEPAEAKDVRFQLARALGEALGRKEEAVKLAREVRATEPHTAVELVRLGEMLVNIEAYDEAVFAFEKAAPLEEDDDVAIGRYLQAASLYAERLDKPNEARGAFEAILDIRDSHLDAYVALSEIYRDTGEWRKLVALGESFVPHADPALRLQILTEIRDVQDQRLGEKELAFIAGCRVYKENPSDLVAAEVLERLALETDGAEELVAVLEDEIEHIVDVDIKVALLRRIARVYAENLKDTTSAETCLNKILELDPSDLRALDDKAKLGAQEDRFDKQIAALETKLDHVGEDTQRKAILLEIARIWEDQVGEVEEAISALQRVLEIDGGDPAALDSLARIYAQEDRHTDLAHILTRKVELTQDPEKNIQLRMQVGALCESELGDAETAIQWYRGVLDFDPGHAGALASLERLYTGLERWSELIAIFEVELGLAQEVEQKMSLLSKMASIYESEFESQKDAAQCFERALQIDGGNLSALRNLERLLRALGEWNRLIEILEHHISLLQDKDEITELLLEIGDVHYRELSRVDKAEQVYNRARELNPESEKALHALGRLYERSGNWFQSLEMLQREADSLGMVPDALPVLLRLGRINEEMLMDIGAAQTAYKRALEIDPTYGSALEALKEIARQQEDWEAYSEYLITQAETSDDDEEKADLFKETAKYFVEVREDESQAIRYYQRALEVLPDDPEGARALAEIYFRNESWAEAGDLYKKVLAKLDKASDAKDYCQKSYRLGYISDKLGQSDEALSYYRKAFEADATYLPALEGLGQALLATEQWEEAQKVFQTILIHHRDALTESEVVDVQWQLGEICLAQDQPDRAYKQFEKCLEVDPDHGPSLRALAGLDQKMGNWEGAYSRLSRLADVVAVTERSEVLLSMSGIAREQLQDATRSIEALERARRSSQPSPDAMEQLAKDYLTANQPHKAVEVLEQAVAAPGDPERMSALNFQLGRIYETAVRNEPKAVEKYNASLDLSPKNVQAFEHIERLLSSRQEWALLEANYRAMIARSKDLNPQVRLVLWRNLAELYRQVMRDVDSAIMAYEVIQKMAPGKPEDQAILAELYAQKPDRRGQSIAMSHTLIAQSENPVPPIRTLRKLYHADRNFDAVYCLCAALVYLNEADEEEKKIFQYLQQGVPPRAQGIMSEDHWRVVLHPSLQSPIGALVSNLVRAAGPYVTRQGKDLGLKKKEQIDVRGSDLYFARMLDYVGKLLNLRAFELYRKGGSVEPLHLLPSQPPALVAGEQSDVFRDSSSRVVLYHAGRTLAYLRPELFLPAVYVGEGLRSLLLGLCMVYNRGLQHQGDPAAVEGWAQHLAAMPQPVLKRLAEPAKLAFPLLAQGPALNQYAAAVGLSVSRAGLLACGDLGAAMRGVSEGGEGASGLPVRDRIKELVLFAVSKPHLDLRKVLGAALAAEKQAQ